MKLKNMPILNNYFFKKLIDSIIYDDVYVFLSVEIHVENSKVKLLNRNILYCSFSTCSAGLHIFFDSSLKI